MDLLIDNKKKSEALKFLPKLNSELMKVAKTGIIKKRMLLEMYRELLERFQLFRSLILRVVISYNLKTYKIYN